MVGLVKRRQSKLPICGGTLISPNFVLTGDKTVIVSNLYFGIVAMIDQKYNLLFKNGFKKFNGKNPNFKMNQMPNFNTWRWKEKYNFRILALLLI